MSSYRIFVWILPFFILLTIFCYAMTDYWYGFMSKEQVEGKMLGWSTLSLVIYIIFLLLFVSRRNLFGESTIHRICILWCVLMPCVIWQSDGSFFFYGSTILWPLLFLTSFLFNSIDVGSFRFFRFFFYGVFLYSTYLFLLNRFMGIEKQTNTIYFVACTLPWILYSTSRFRQIIVLVFFSFLMILSLKRAMLLSLSLIWLLFFFNILTHSNRKISVLLLFFILLFLRSYVFTYVDVGLEGLLSERINAEETAEGRNRLAIYALTWDMIRNSDTLSLMLGHGHFGVNRDSLLQISAHNDFLECIYDYGVIIFILYLYMWYFLIKRSIYFYRIESVYFLPYVAGLCVFLTQSLFEHMLLYTSWFNYLVLFWGGVEGMISMEQEQETQIDY